MKPDLPQPDAPRQDITRILLAVLAVALLIFASLWVLQPFLGATVWATMVVVATWPLMESLQARLWGRRGLATGVMVLGLLLLLFVPLSIALSTVVSHADQVMSWAPKLLDAEIPEPPAWLASLPVIGENLAAFWHKVAQEGLSSLLAMIKPYVGSSLKWTAAQAGNLGMVGLQFLLTVAIAAILYSEGENAVQHVRRFVRRLAGEQGDAVVTLAGQAIRGVALGIVVTALVQTALGGLGLWISGVPFAGLLSAVMLMACLAQIGPALVLAPAVAWLYWSGDNGWATVLLIWTLLVTTLDNFLRPWLIKKGADLPLLLIFAGVIGGLLAFGLVGLFIGPVVLAVTYTLLEAWINEGLPAKAQALREKTAARQASGGRRAPRN
ncbi:AI-2E family transporter YdiK [Paucibacter sp. DJ1R-11]|uniref:AI-2E family transporter YdiK n=1 Tax=Paucibacter sp. DJ1R-11 TaxID=2893556 RepID=UPI0021E3D824|nr:AI-2E family transporter YdiK [Paucibacter sp. DJ1R-11]MCV2363487.1 AI-2E family transporter YdiK [Paucibacter sp. DJ1R-11]